MNERLAGDSGNLFSKREPKPSPRRHPYHEPLYRYNPASLEDDMKEINELIDTEADFEPIWQLGVSSSEVLRHAANLLRFIEEYEERTGSLDLPKPWNQRD